MNRIGIVWAVICCLSLASCQKEQFVQHIKSCADCVSCYRWSWGNGVGEPKGGSCIGNDQGCCVIKVLDDGELRMSYQVELLGCLNISGGASFEDDNIVEIYKSFKTSVKKNSEIYISGYKCKIKNVRIVCHGRTEDDNGDDF